MFDKLKNRLLIRKYPFLKPKNCFTGEELEGYDYSWTMLDDMNDGWRDAFGLQMCEEIKQALIKEGVSLDEYRITQIKEKFGELRWYDNGATEEIYDIVDKYSRLSQKTCIVCGKPAKYISKGWVCPYCDKCANSILDSEFKIFGNRESLDYRFEDIEEYYR